MNPFGIRNSYEVTKAMYGLALENAMNEVVAPAMHFGKGNLVVDTGTYYGSPSVFIWPATMLGAVGASAKREHAPEDKLMDGEFVLSFPTMAQAKAVADALVTPVNDAA